jgi:uncharacterized protein (DUF305 family)
MAPTARIAALGGALMLALVLSACGGGENASTTGAEAPPAASAEVSQEHNEADIRFAQEMIPHHRQATQMAALAADRSDSDDVKALAEEIIAAQQPEIETMTAFLEMWGQAMDNGPMGGMNMGGMNGMAPQQQLTELENASGPAFDRLFLQLMVAHHEGAIEMARAEQADGLNPQAIELAKQIESAQTEEIARMQDLLPTI